MKQRILPGLAFLFCILANSTFAQQAAAPANGNAPSPEVKTIFSFKDEVGLTDDQENKLKALLYDEQSLITSHNDTLKSLGAELSKLIEDKADMPTIKSKLENIAKIQVEVSCINIEDARKVETILTPAQLDKWKDIQKRFSAPVKS